MAVTLEATIAVREGDESSEIPAAELYIGPMITTLPAGGIITHVRFPVWSEGRIGTGFHEVSARRSDFALVSGAAQVALDADGTCLAIAVGVGGACDMPVRLEGLGEALVGRRLDEESIRDAVAAAAEALDTVDDLHASAAYRRRVAATLARRAILQAQNEARDKAMGAPRAG